jgi:hypothetical protein
MKVSIPVTILMFICLNPITTNSDPDISIGPETYLLKNESAYIQQPIGNAYWGFQLIPPEGWTYQEIEGGMILGHHTIPGIILIYPHILESMASVKSDLVKGIQEGYDYLVLQGEISTISENVLAGDYQGYMEGSQVKAKGYGTLSPYGSGGAFIIAVSTPEMLGQEIIRDAQWIAVNLIYKKLETGDLVRHFAGQWASFTTNTSSWIYFNADGTYDEKYESSYSGDLSGGGNWNAHGAESDKGRWTVRGNRDQGTIIVIMASGEEIYYEYRVQEERGQKYYGEYWFNGKLYSKSEN